MTEMPQVDPQIGRGRPLLLTGWALVLFAVTLMLHGRYNDFPFFYHPDEWEKVHQVMTGEWNFHHPMLLLTTTKCVMAARGGGLSEQDVVEVGRWVSAGFSAAAVVALSLLAFVWRGWGAAVVTGLALMLHHQIFELSHYMKEDTALLMGVALTFLAAFVFWRKPDPWRAAVLGAAVALAISGKYIGAFMLGAALPLLWLAPGARWRSAACFIAAMGCVLIVVNLPLLLNLDAFEKSLGREMSLVVHGQRGVTRSVPHTQYWNVFRDNSTPAIWLLLACFLAARWRERRSVSLAEWLVIGFPFVYALALSFSPKSNDRYFLPATAVFTLLAGLGVADAARLVTGRMRHGLALAACGALLVVSQVVAAPAPLDWRVFRQYLAAFQHDDNKELIAWVRAELPPGAVIAKDSRVELPDPGIPADAFRFGAFSQTIIAKRYAADLGTLDVLRARGVTHVAVSESDYGRFFLRSVRPQAAEAEDFARRKSFYEDLFQHGVLLFRRERGTVLYLHPGIRLYRLPPKEG